MSEERIEREIRYGLPVFREEYRVNPYDSDRVKEIMRDKRTHILATCMAAYPFTPTNELAKEFGIKPKVINALASLYGIKKSKETRSAINRENGALQEVNKYNCKTVEQVARNGRIIAVFNSASAAARALGVGKDLIISRCIGKTKRLLNGFRFRYKSN